MTPGGSLVPAKGNRGPPVPPVRRNFLRLSCCFCSLGTRAGESSGPWEDTPPEPQLLGEPEGVAGRKACSKRARPLPASTTLRPQRRRGLFPARWAWAFTLATGHRDSAQGSGRFVNAGGGAVFERPLPYPGSGGRVGDALVIADDTAPPPRGAEAFRRPACVRGACVVRGCVVRAWCVRAWRAGVRACVVCVHAAQRRSPRRCLQLSRRGPPSCVAPGQRPGIPAACKRPKETYRWDLLPFSLAEQGAQWSGRAQAGRGSRPGGRSRAGWLVAVLPAGGPGRRGTLSVWATRCG